MRIVKRYPILMVLIGIIVFANNMLRFAPGQAQSGNMAYYIPAFLVLFGLFGMFMKKRLAR